MAFSRDAILGCLVGGALGDAIGGLRERGRFSLSDDTQLTLATCEAIAATRSVEPQDIANRFLDWYRRGALTGLGSATLKALRDLDAGQHWALAGARGEMAAGNGAAMRIAPLAFVLDPLDPSHRVRIRDVCRITHHSDEAYIGALAVLLALRQPAAEWAPPELFGALAAALPDSRVRDRLLAFAELPIAVPFGEVAKRFGCTGYVVETVPLALLLATRLTSESFESHIQELAEAGGDADTIGSIAAQVAGFRLGFSGLPRRNVETGEIRSIRPIFEAFAQATVRTT